jgi:bacterial/archaeal transporter family protein
VSDWFLMAVGAAVFYGLHQVFTKAASKHIGDGIGGFVVESTAAVTIGAYMLYLWLSGKWNQPAAPPGYLYAMLTGICVGAGTVLFFLMFQREAPLSAVPAVLAAGSAIMAVAGWTVFGEGISWQKVLGLALSVAALILLKGQ